MPQELIKIGTADAKQGDTAFAWATKCNNNFTELYSAIGQGFANNVKIVNSLDDLPDAISGGITLDSNTTYIAGADIVSADRFILQEGTVIAGNTPFSAAWVYTGTGAAFTALDANVAFNFTVIVAPNASVVFDSKATAGNGTTFGLNIVTITQCQKIATLESLRSINITNVNVLSCTDGVSISGADNWERVSISKLGATTSSASFVGLDVTGSLLNAVEVDNYNVIGVPGGIGIKGDIDSVNINSNIIASITNCEFLGGMTQLDGITVDDIRYSFFGNAGIPDSVITANPYLTTVTTVPIVGSSVYVKVNQGNWSFTDASRVSVSTDGDIVNLLESEVRVQISGSITMEKTGGGSDLITAIFALNDDPALPESLVTEMGTDNNSPTNVGLTGIFTLQPGDSISMWVANQDSTSNVIVEYAKFSLLRVL